MRTNFYELLSQQEFDAKKEYDTLWFLFFKEGSVVRYQYMVSLAEYIDKTYFRSLSFRGSFTCLDDLMKAIGLVEHASVTVHKLLLLCESLVAIISEEKVRFDRKAELQINTITGNIQYILERTNHEIRFDDDGRTIIVEKSKSATLAAQVVADPTVAFDLLEYNHFAIKGKLEEKKKLLVSIGTYIEPILKSRTLQKAGYKQLESDAGFVFNNFHIRHNNKEGAKAQDYIISISDDDLETWYDNAYELALAVIIINDYLSVGTEISELKANYTWRT